jgi:glycosyltransferase involved in cell wall biosynthesis
LRRTLICFAGDVWGGNPHSRHHLMRRFAADGWDVLWVEAVAMRSLAGSGRAELRRVRSKLRATSGLRCVEERLHVLRPLPIPPAGRAGRAIQLAMLRVQVTRSVRQLRLGPRAVTWFSVPVAAPLRGRLGDRASVLYYQDRYDEFSHVNRPYLQRCLRSLAEGCDLTIASGQELAQDLRALGASPVIVRHGVDVERFARQAPVPPQLVGLERPLIGCVGLVDDHLDMAALRAIAQSIDRGTVVLVGGVNTDVAGLRHPRIRFFDRRPYVEMPAFMQAFDACLVPFAHNRLTAAVNPIKLREYLAAGRPTIAAALPETTPYADVVELVNDGGDWAAAVARALADDDACARTRRRDRVAGESWDVSFRRIEALVSPLLERDP